MDTKLSAVLLVMLLVVPLQGKGTAPTEDIIDPVDIRSYYLEDYSTGKLLLEKKPDMRTPAASTTKLVTAMIARKLLKDTSVITIPREATKAVPTKIYLRAGEKYYFRDLLRAMLINSANDAAIAVAMSIAGTEAAFVKKMNEWSEARGFEKTRFSDVTGLSAGSVTTARDIAKIFRMFISDRSMADIVARKSCSIKSLKGRKTFFRTSNRFNDFISTGTLSITGKTGFTRKAGFCFTGLVDTGDRKYIISVLGAQSYWRQLYLLMSHVEKEPGKK